jgi:hypothetical protein
MLISPRVDLACAYTIDIPAGNLVTRMRCSFDNQLLM